MRKLTVAKHIDEGEIVEIEESERDDEIQIEGAKCIYILYFHKGLRLTFESLMQYTNCMFIFHCRRIMECLYEMSVDSTRQCRIHKSKILGITSF